MTPPFQVIRQEEMEDLEAKMVEIVKIEEHVVAMNATDAKTTKM